MSASKTYALILAGGSGTRFWPASRKQRPKQLLALGPSGNKSLLRATVDRLARIAPPDRVRIATGVHLAESIRSELPELSEQALLLEPMAKNTAPCIAWAAFDLFRADPDAVLVVLPSDQFAANGSAFEATITEAISCAAKGAIATVGIVPTRPETGYGYIEAERFEGSASRPVLRFVEKPNYERACEYLSSGRYLWNAGIFVFRVRDMVAAFREFLPSLADAASELCSSEVQSRDPDRVLAFFEQAPSISIDYAIMERASGLCVVPGDFGWSDLGSWESAWELSPHDAEGNSAPASAVLVDASDNLLVDLRSPDRRGLMTALGIRGLAIIQTDDALLVIPRERSQDVRAIVEALAQRGQRSLL